jgi:ribosome modulation factor
MQAGVITTDQARNWGIKAAQAGLAHADTPYLNIAFRAAWRDGYNEMVAATARLQDY